MVGGGESENEGKGMPGTRADCRAAEKEAISSRRKLQRKRNQAAWEGTALPRWQRKRLRKKVNKEKVGNRGERENGDCKGRN